MSRRRYRYDKTLKKVVEIFDEPRRAANGPMVLPDLDRFYNGGFTSPIDGEFITSRSQLRAHEHRHNVRHAGDFKPGELIGEEKRRVAKSQEGLSGVDFKWV